MSAESLYSSFDPCAVPLSSWRETAAVLKKTCQSSLLPLPDKPKALAFFERFVEDPAVDRELKVRVSQGRAYVLTACCSALHPLDPLISRVGQSACEVNELLARFSKKGEKKRRTVAVQGDVDALRQLLSARNLKLRPEQANISLCCGNPQPADFIAALKTLKAGGELFYKLCNLDSELSWIIAEACACKLFSSAFLSIPEATNRTKGYAYIYAQNYQPDPTIKWEPWLLQVESQPVPFGEKAFHSAPFERTPDFQICADYWHRRLNLAKEATFKKALRMCRMVLQHSPVVRPENVTHLLESCRTHSSSVALMADYEKRWSLWESEPVIDLENLRALGELLQQFQ